MTLEIEVYKYDRWVKIAELAAGKPDGMPSVHRFRFRHEP